MAIQLNRLNTHDWFVFNKLQKHQINYVQRLISQATSSKIDYSQNLAGNISESLVLKDDSNFVINDIFADFLKDNNVSSARGTGLSSFFFITSSRARSRAKDDEEQKVFVFARVLFLFFFFFCSFERGEEREGDDDDEFGKN